MRLLKKEIIYRLAMIKKYDVNFLKIAKGPALFNWWLSLNLVMLLI